MSKPHITIYTDGACKGNPGPGGWGVVLRSGEHEKHLHGGAHDTTNNRMEISAVIHALKALKQASVVDLYTDSQYVQKGVSEWLSGWKARGWKTADIKKTEPKIGHQRFPIFSRNAMRVIFFSLRNGRR